MDAIKPAVSVMMLAYNRPQFMRQAIESVLNQTFRDFELLILDNGSKGDEVYNIAKEYAVKDSRVQASRVTDGLGEGGGRNKQLHQAQADYIAIIDDDDFWELDKLEAQVDFMNNNPNVGMYFSSVTIVNMEGISTGEILDREYINPPIQTIKDAMPDNNSIFGTGIFRRPALLTVGGWRSYFAIRVDADLFYRLQEKIHYASTSKKLLNWRIIKKPAKRNWTQLSTNKKVFLYETAARISALYRRKQKPDPIDSNPVIEDLVTKDFFSLTEMLSECEWHKQSRKMVKYLLRERDYIRLNRFMKTYGALPDKRIKLYVNLYVWSLWYGRLGWLWTR